MLKTKDVTIADEGRDKGKQFRITEMPALRLEKWAMRLFLALMATGAPVPEESLDAGAAALAGVDVQAIIQRLPFETMEPLLDEMLGCVAYLEAVPGGQALPLPLGDHVEEVSTLLYLRAEVIELHLGFSATAALSNLKAAAGKFLSSSATPTSPSPSEPPSPTDAPPSTS